MVERGEVSNIPMVPVSSARGLQSKSDLLIRELSRLAPLVNGDEAASNEAILAEVFEILRYIVGDAGVGYMLPLGAYQLGVLQMQDEVDVVFVAPAAMQLAHLHASLLDALRQSPHVSDLCTVDAEGVLCAPGCRFVYRGRGVMLLLSHQCRTSHGGFDFYSLDSDEGVSYADAGYIAHESSKKLLWSVPDVRQFQLLLRFVRLWAKQSGVFGSRTGFFGGIAWAICCAHVCNRFPDLEILELALQFFDCLSQWDWRYAMSLSPSASFYVGERSTGERERTLTEICREGEDIPLMKPAMVVLAPGSTISTTPNVSATTKAVILKELRRGHMKLMFQAHTITFHLNDFFLAQDFFSRFKHFLQFEFTATSQAVFALWISWGKKQMRGLMHLLELLRLKNVTFRPWPRVVSSSTSSDDSHMQAFFIGLSRKKVRHDLRTATSQCTVKAGDKENLLDLRQAIVKFLHNIVEWPDAWRYAGMFDLRIRHVQQSEVLQFLRH
jgi:poly(A) polymerase Pap1